MFDDEVYEELAELESAEEFLGYFSIDHDPAVVRVNRLHILQRFHDYIVKEALPDDCDQARFDFYGGQLQRAYNDFVESDARTEKVFKVFRMGEPQTQTVSFPISNITMAS